MFIDFLSVSKIIEILSKKIKFSVNTIFKLWTPKKLIQDTFSNEFESIEQNILRNQIYWKGLSYKILNPEYKYLQKDSAHMHILIYYLKVGNVIQASYIISLLIFAF